MKALLVDGDNLLVRSMFAKRLQDLVVNGMVTGPLHAFLSSLSRLVREESPDRMLVAWDCGPSERRTQLDPNYKAHRQNWGSDERRRRGDSYSLAEQFLDLAGVPQLRIPGQEADDLIAGAWRGLPPQGEGDRIVIVSADKDLTQLLGPNPAGIATEQIRLGSHDTATDRWTVETLQQYRGWTPEQVPLVMALMGDQADGVRGVPGIGAKRAQKLLESNGWDLDRVADAVRRTHGPQAADQVTIDHQLVDLRHVELVVDVPSFHPVTRSDEDASALEYWLDRFALDQIHTRFRADSLWVLPKGRQIAGR